MSAQVSDDVLDRTVGKRGRHDFSASIKAPITRAPVIASREMASYFHSPIAYVAMMLFLFATGVAFLMYDFIPGQPNQMRQTFEWMVWALVFIVPILCMGLLAQEWATGTIETLMTAPVAETDVVLGKFFGSLGFFAVLVLPTLLFVALLWWHGALDFGPILSGYLGVLLTGSLFISIGLFCSSLTRSQVVAAVLSVAILFVITIVPWWLSENATLGEFWRALANACVFRRYSDFAKGVIDTGNVIFFIAMTSVFLFLTVKKLEARRWQ